MTPLAPCPHCLSEPPVVALYGQGTAYYVVVCQREAHGCGLSGPWFRAWSAEDAIRAWNALPRRGGPEPLSRAAATKVVEAFDTSIRALQHTRAMFLRTLEAADRP